MDKYQKDYYYKSEKTGFKISITLYTNILNNNEGFSLKYSNSTI